MRLPEFDLLEPTTIPDALTALAAHPADARLVAGGTALVAMLRLGLLRPALLISLDRVAGLRDLRVADGHLALGAMIPVAAVHRAPAVRAGWPLLAEACGRVATPAIRSAATLGGNLAYAEAASDPAPALLCLDAQVQVAGAAGAR